MSSRGEKLLLALVPFVAVVAVAVGLRVGAPNAVRSVVVYGAPPSGTGGLAWQVIAFDEDNRARWPAAGVPIEAFARVSGTEVRWQGRTNQDGVAEAQFALTTPNGMSLAVWSGEKLLAQGLVSIPAKLDTAAPTPVWMPFARRQGPIMLDVAVLGQRVAPGFPASLWVRATDASTHARLAGIRLAAVPDASLLSVVAMEPTSAGGWAELSATAVGLAVSLTLHALSPDGRTGDWEGGLHMSPGAAIVRTRARWLPDEEPEVEVIAPGTQRIVYLEIDNARGRAWAAHVSLAGNADGMSGARARGPKLPPGLYWAAAAADAMGATKLERGTSVRPFFVASSDDAAFAFGEETAECAPPSDGRETSRALAACLAMTAATPVPRWVALDGFSMERAKDAHARFLGLVIALGAILVAALLEGTLVLRAAASSRASLSATHAVIEKDQTIARVSGVAVALLVALLGFALFAAFLVRAG